MEVELIRKYSRKIDWCNLCIFVDDLLFLNKGVGYWWLLGENWYNISLLWLSKKFCCGGF